MSYNLCNLPKQITTVNGKTVKYTYFADGTKFKAVDAAGNGFVYTGSLRWSVQNGILTPESIAITGGRAVYSSNGWAANYYITDHLGSVRAVTVGFDFNGAINGIEVMQHHGSHAKYTEYIREEIKKWAKDNANYTPEAAKEFMENLAKRTRDTIFEYKKAKS